MVHAAWRESVLNNASWPYWCKRRVLTVDDSESEENDGSSTNSESESSGDLSSHSSPLDHSVVPQTFLHPGYTTECIRMCIYMHVWLSFVYWHFSEALQQLSFGASAVTSLLPLGESKCICGHSELLVVGTTPDTLHKRHSCVNLSCSA